MNKLLYLDEQFYSDIQSLMSNARKHVLTITNSTMVKTYWMIGKMIVEKQGGEKRAEYGKGLIKELSKRMTEDYGKGFTVSNLKYMKQFYLTFQKSHAVRGELTWTHYRLLLKLENEKARDFYIEEAIAGQWSTRQLERQINSYYYERMLLSSDKDGLKEDTNCLEAPVSAEDIVKDTYVLEFLGFDDYTKLQESDLEQGIIDHLQKFLLELGNGFCFVARQKRIILEDDSFYIDLVFYNIPLRCYVLIELKTHKLTHQDIGQMQMYVNYYQRQLMNEGDNPPIGIILCRDKNKSVVRYTLPEDNKSIYASKYSLYLPTEEQFRKVIEEDF